MTLGTRFKLRKAYGIGFRHFTVRLWYRVAMRVIFRKSQEFIQPVGKGGVVNVFQFFGNIVDLIPVIA